MPGLVHIVDDDASFRTAIKRRLKKAGYEVACYPSAENFLGNLPGDSELGCVLLDVRMRGLSGPELQGQLRELGSTLPIVFLTGQFNLPTTVRTIKAGAEDFLIKPVSSDQLLPAVDRAVTRHEIARGQKAKLDMVRACIACRAGRRSVGCRTDGLTIFNSFRGARALGWNYCISLKCKTNVLALRLYPFRCSSRG